MPRSTRVATVVCACVAAAALMIAPSAQATRLGAAPVLPAGAREVASVADATPLRVTVTLRPRSPAALAAFATAVSTPGTPLYRDYVTPAQFAKRFGATSQEVDAVEASLRAHGLAPGPVSANSLSIRITATAGQFARAFSISLARVELANGTGAIVNQQAPSLDSAIAPDVQAVLGLDTLAPARPLLVRSHAFGAQPRLSPHVVTGGPQPCAAASSGATSTGGYTDDQIATAYGLSGLYQSAGPGGSPDEGAGQTVAILELEPYDPGDIAAYEQCYGINAGVNNVLVDGGAGSGSGSGEAALDIENVIGLAPNANVDVYEGPNSGSGPYDTFSAIISQGAAQVVTASWGQCEPVNGYSQAAAESTLFREAAAEGISIFSAAGDDGTEDCYTPRGSPDLTPEVDDPASQPFVTGVGGTTLSAIGPRPSERVWNDGPSIGAGGGGVSSFWAMPAYQTSAPSFLHLIQSDSSRSACGASSGYCREVPDVSADADPATGYVIYWNGGWQTVGGTSGAAPAWAALTALANESAGCDGRAIGFANPALYNAAAAAYSNDFNDITSGDNDMTGSNGGRYPAGPGYDMASGLGTPNGTALAGALCSDLIGVGNPGLQRSTIGTTVGLQIQASDSRDAGLTYAAAGLPTGLSINRTTGKITGRPTRLGSFTVTVTAADTFGTRGQTSFQWTVQGAPTVSRPSLLGVGSARPNLSFTLTAGRDAPGIATVNVVLPRGLHFTKSRATVTVTGRGGRHVKFTAQLQGVSLVLKLRAESTLIRVTIASPRLAAQDSLTAAVARRRASRLIVTVRVTDADRVTTKLALKVTPKS